MIRIYVKKKSLDSTILTQKTEANPVYFSFVLILRDFKQSILQKIAQQKSYKKT